MIEYFAYFHVDDHSSIHMNLLHIHDTFCRALPDTPVYVGWQEETRQGIRYRVRIEAIAEEDGVITKPFRKIAETFDPYIRLGILLRKSGAIGYQLVDLFELQPRNT